MNTGTPKTLSAAIANGIQAAVQAPRHAYALTIERHVRDFLSQKVGAAYLLTPGDHVQMLDALWFQITGELPNRSALSLCTYCTSPIEGGTHWIAGDPYGLCSDGGDENPHPYCAACAGAIPTKKG